MHTFKWADDLFYRLNQSAALNSGLSLHSKRGLGTTTEHRTEAYITFRQCVASYHEKKYNKIKLGIFLIKLQDCSGRTECCICIALHQTKIPSTDKMAVILSTILPPIKKKKVLKDARTFNVLYSAAYPRIPSVSWDHILQSLPCGYGCFKGKGTALPKLAFHLHKPAHIWMQWPCPNTNTDFPLLPSFLCLVCPTLVAFVTLPHVIPPGMLWSNFPKLQLFFMTFKRSLVIL